MGTESLQTIIQLVRSGEIATRYAGLVNVQTHPAGGLALLNYTENCQYQRAWDDVTVWCRGLVLDTDTWQVAALPFPKFFNLGELPSTSIEALPQEPFSVYEKLDGSLGISYRRGEEIALASRGSFTSREAVEGTAFLRQLANVHDLPRFLTFLFEVICKDSRCVSRYDFEGLVLLAIFDRSAGRELEWAEVQAWANRLGCRTPTVCPFGTLAEVIESRARLPASLEGYVIRFASGLRVKVKGNAYLAVYKLIAGISEERLLQELADGDIEQFRRQLPEEFHVEIEQVITDLQQRAATLEVQTMDMFERAPRGTDRKSFALWVQANVPADLRAALFQLFDNKMPNWYKSIRAGRGEPGSPRKQ
jgi:RNA ligase